MSDSPYIINVTAENFQTVVIEGSKQVPVLVDFWAEWCNPCQMLIPVVSKLAEEYGGKFILAKINSDEQQDLAAACGVKSLPTVKMFKNGEVADEFMGALPESEVKAFIDKHLEQTADPVYEQAMQAYAQGDVETALQLLNQALANDPDNAELKLDIAKVVANQEDYESAQALIDSLNDEQKNEPEVREFVAQLALKQRLNDAPDSSILEARITKDNNDLEAYLQLSDIYAASSEIEKSIEMLLHIMRKDRKFNDDAGRKGLINLFDMLGAEHPLTKVYRRKMFGLMH